MKLVNASCLHVFFFHAIDYDHSSQSFMRQNRWTLKTNSGSGRQVADINLRLKFRAAIWHPRFSWEQLWGDHWLVTFYEPKLDFYKPYNQSVSCYFLVCWLDGSQKHKKSFNKLAPTSLLQNHSILPKSLIHKVNIYMKCEESHA